MDFKNASGGQAHDKLFTTDVGPALYPHLLTPDTRFDEHGKYKTGVGLEPDEERHVRESLTALFRAAFPEARGEPYLPIKMEDGRAYLVAKSTYRPKLYSPDRKEITDPLLVRNGHKIRVSGRVRPFRNGGLVSGVSCYLAAVQIIEPLESLETYRVDGGKVEKPFLAIPEAEATSRAPAPTFEDDLPF